MKRLNGYCQFLLSSQCNYTQTYYADHKLGISHDQINRYLRLSALRPRMLWDSIAKDIVPCDQGYIVFDDTVLDKSHSRKIECAGRHYSGNTHGLITGISVVTCVYVNPEIDQFWAIDYRIYDPGRDGRTKLDHVADMLRHIHTHKNLPYYAVLMDSWYATR